MTWMQTHSGRKFDLVHPTPEMVDFDDIATALSRIPRFAGHTRHFYSVAQHCCLGADWLWSRSTAVALAFLLHDAHEAYIGDMPSPVSRAASHYAIDSALVSDGDPRERAAGARTGIRGLKDALDEVIYRAARLKDDIDDAAMSALAHTDLRMLRTERDQLMADKPEDWHEDIEKRAPLPIVIEPWSMERARNEWMLRFNAWARL